MDDHKIKLVAICKRPGVYEVGGVTFNAESAEDAIRKYARMKK